ncbi:3'-5' exonuclease [candidate division WOR-3 bacterium]|nr:3'-5' exonuclease [candidate division WOR-3 bacterium]
MELFFDTETSGFVNKNLASNHPEQAWIMQIAFILSDEKRIYTEFSSLIRSGGRSCHPSAQAVHQISIEECDKGGMPENEIFDIIGQMFFDDGRYLVAHNYSFDIELLCQYIERNDCKIEAENLRKIPHFCTMKSSTNLCKLPGKFGKYKWPKLTELHRFLFAEDFEGAHDALADVRATRRCFYKLREIL